MVLPRKPAPVADTHSLRVCPHLLKNPPKYLAGSPVIRPRTVHLSQCPEQGLRVEIVALPVGYLHNCFQVRGFRVSDYSQFLLGYALGNPEEQSRVGRSLRAGDSAFFKIVAEIGCAGHFRKLVRRLFRPRFAVHRESSPHFPYGGQSRGVEV